MIKITLIGSKCPLLLNNAGLGSLEASGGAALLQDIKKVVAVDYLLRCMAGQRTAIILVMLCQRIKG